ncbi:MAG: 16S rRNA (guanine(966)-N(2))-methyltransferase RsmD [Pseudomonadales bacterium]
MNKLDNKLRIIGGKWRSRKVTFADSPDIRPSSDRIRETLFNWLQPHLADAATLELYAGSGVLSLEALSRGAKHATLVEKDAATARHLLTEFNKFADEADYKILTGDAREFIATANNSYDLIFLDPPFQSGELAMVGSDAAALLNPQGMMYLESSEPAGGLMPAGMEAVRQGKAGAVHYALLKKCALLKKLDS